jgi:hypothetical protein
LIATNAVGASAHLASTMGKAPAAPSASTRSVAGFSATTIIGPWSDMGRARTVTFYKRMILSENRKHTFGIMRETM